MIYFDCLLLQLDDGSKDFLQEIESPGYPNSYPNNAYETWLLTAPATSVIFIQFHSFYVRLIVESKNRAKYKIRFSFSQTETGYDFVTIYDGSNDQSTQIEKLSGNLGSFNISSTGNSLFVKFESDGSVSKDGFLATIQHNSYHDFLSIHNGGSDDSEMVAKITGTMNDTKISIPGNQMFVVFHTNDEIVRKGFHALIMES